uniref:Diphthine synthase n=1 Tax=Ignisphaera aggregans TaxID=334771 RepID=A0A7C4BBH9_9CREN
MLRLIGIGLSIDMLPLGNLKKILSCDEIVVDSYTSIWFPSAYLLTSLLIQLGKTVIIAPRNYLEGSEVKNLIKRALDKEVCILVTGDPLIATTHSSIITEALANNVEVEVVPAASIFNVSISLSCLQVYRFGKIVTVVSPKNGIVYEYPYDVIKMNRLQNLHTLLLLEIDVEKNYYMKPYEAIKILLDIQERREENIISLKDIAIILGDVLSCRQKIWILTIEEILRMQYEFLYNKLYTMIIPSRKLHPVEEECLNLIRKGKMSYLCAISEEELKKIAQLIYNQ